jgi:transcriptional regulator with XRE-family HTH domain
LRHGLSPEELAYLVNQRSPSAIAQYESGARVPTLESALALQVVFGVKPNDLFPALFDCIESDVMARAKELLEKLNGLTDRLSVAKRGLLEEMPGRQHSNDIEA